MPAIAPPSPPTVSTPPTTADPINFDARMDAWLLEQTDLLLPYFGDVAANAYANAQEAATQATAAAGSAAAASASVATAAGHVASAQDARDLAAASALTAINAPGTSGTSTSSLAVSAGSKSATTQTGKAWVAGQPVVLARTAAPTTVQMYGVIASYNAGTGAMVVEVPAGGVVGSGTFSDWTIALTGPRGTTALVRVPVTGTTYSALPWQEPVLRNAGQTVVTFPSAPADGDRITVSIENGRYDNSVARNGKLIMGLAEDMVLDDPDTPWEFVYSSSLGDWRFA